MSIRVNRLAPAIGGAITGADLSRPLDHETARSIADALTAHGMLAFLDQAISDEAHARFGRYFGELAKFPPSDNWEVAVPEIFRGANTDTSGNLLSADDERVKLIMLNWLWHIDSSYRTIPTKGAILHGIEVIEDAGDTIFANMYAAYEALPAATKDRIAGLFARHSFEFLVKTRGLPPLSDDAVAALPPVNHPLVRQHADGRKSLYLSPPYMETIVGWNQPESLALIGELTEWATQERFICRHRWHPHDVIMWDNGWTMHMVTPYDISRAKRLVHGVVILGTEPIEPVSPTVNKDR